MQKTGIAFSFIFILKQCPGVLESSWIGFRRNGLGSCPVYSSCLLSIKFLDSSEPEPSNQRRVPLISPVIRLSPGVHAY